MGRSLLCSSPLELPSRARQFVLHRLHVAKSPRDGYVSVSTGPMEVEAPDAVGALGAVCLNIRCGLASMVRGTWYMVRAGVGLLPEGMGIPGFYRLTRGRQGAPPGW